MTLSKGTQLVAPGSVLVSPATAAILMRHCRLRLVLLEQRRRDGLGLEPQLVELLDCLDAAAAAHASSTAAQAAAMSALIARPYGRGGRPEPGSERIMVSTTDVAQRIDRSPRQVRRLIEQRHLHGDRVSGCWMVDQASVDEYLVARAKGFPD